MLENSGLYATVTAETQRLSESSPRDSMKTILIAIAVLELVSFPSISPVYSQSGAGSDGSRPDQWVSHQMNQPRPELGKRRAVSQERVEEIRKLYELARKEAEARAKGKPRSSQ